MVELSPRPRTASSRSGRSDVYVGSSAFSPNRKLALHHVRRTGSKHVQRRGVRLLPRLYVGVGPFANRETARQAERALARKLKRRGYHVFGACEPSKEKACFL